MVEITLQQLTHKLVMLCALVTGQHSQSLHLILNTPEEKWLICISHRPTGEAVETESGPTYSCNTKISIRSQVVCHVNTGGVY